MRYFTNFSEYPTQAGIPTGWTARWFQVSRTYSIIAAPELTGGKALRTSSTFTGNAPSLLSWNSIDGDPARANVETLLRLRSSVTVVTDTSNLAGSVIRATQSRVPLNSFDLVDTGHNHYLVSNATVQRNSIWTRSAGAFPGIISTGPPNPFTANEFLWQRFRAEGNTLKAKQWNGKLEDEPDWEIVVTEPINLAAGWVGLSINATFSAVFDYDLFAVGTDGDDARIPSSAVVNVLRHYHTQGAVK